MIKMIKEANLKNYCYKVTDTSNSVKSVTLTKALNKILNKTLPTKADKHVMMLKL